MIELLEDYIRNNWDSFHLPFSLPQKLSYLFLKGFRKTIFILFNDHDSQPFAVLKISNDPVAFYRLQREYQTLSFLSMEGRLKGSTPLPLAFFEMRGHKCVFESALEGIPMVYAMKGIRTRRGSMRMKEIFNRVVDALVALHNPSSPHEKDKKKQIVVEHGDFNPSNIHVSRNGIKIFDWEYSSLRGVPLKDLLDFSLKYVFFSRYLTKEIRREQPAFNDFEEAFLSRNSHSQIIWETLNRYSASLGLDRSAVREIFSIFVRKYLDEQDARSCCRKLDILL